MPFLGKLNSRCSMFAHHLTFDSGGGKYTPVRANVLELGMAHTISPRPEEILSSVIRTET
jgi:hypothetical protein